MFDVKGPVHYEAKYTVRYDRKPNTSPIEKKENYNFQARKSEQAIDLAQKYTETLREKYRGKWSLDIHLDSLLRIEDITPKK